MPIVTKMYTVLAEGAILGGPKVAAFREKRFEDPTFSEGWDLSLVENAFRNFLAIATEL